MRGIPAGAILGIALAAASCGGESSTEPDDDTLTGEEALALLEVAMGQGPRAGRRRDVREREHDP